MGAWHHGSDVFEKFALSLTEEQRAQIEVVAGDGARWIDNCTSKYFPNASLSPNLRYLGQKTI